MEPDDKAQKIAQLEAEVRRWREAAQSAAATAERAIGRLQRAEPVVKAAIAWADGSGDPRAVAALYSAANAYRAGEPS